MQGDRQTADHPGSHGMPRKIFRQTEPTAKLDKRPGSKRKTEAPVSALQWKRLETKTPFGIPGIQRAGGC